MHGLLAGQETKGWSNDYNLADNRRQHNFHHLIEITTNELFRLMKLTINCSDANIYAVTSVTQGNTSGCLVACGSYVLGDSGP